jgi:hypothetical protein
MGRNTTSWETSKVFNLIVEDYILFWIALSSVFLCRVSVVVKRLVLYEIGVLSNFLPD